jgi:hypothetical protein
MAAKWIGGCFAVFWVSFWSLLTLIFDGFLLWGAYCQLVATGYPSVTGEIIQSVVHTESGSDGDSYRPQISYTYTVDRVRYTGDTYRYGKMSSNDGNAARIVSAHPVGKSVAVYYNPSSPGDAVLRTGIEGTDLFLALFLTPFNVVMLFGWGFAWQCLRRPNDQSAFTGFRVTQQDERLHVLLNDPRIAVAAISAGAVSFLLVFVIGFSSGFSPPLPVALGAWALIVAAAVIGYIRDHWQTGKPPRELVFDEFGRKIEVFRMSRVEPARVIDSAAVKSVQVAIVETTDSDGNVQRRHEPSLVFLDANGQEVRELLGSWGDRNRAEALADGIHAWLERCGRS